MRFSIITITFNAERFLKKTLESVVAQDFSDYEHLIWDGGSTDATLEIISQFPHVKLFQGSDRGIADAMNRGASFAKGDFLLHLHADDLLAHPKVLTFVDTCLKQHADVEWIYGLASNIDEEGRVCKHSNYRPFSPKRLRRYNLMAHPATLISRSLFQAVKGFRTDLRYCMDYDLWLRLARLTSPFHLPTPIAFFREHKKSLSSSHPVEVADEAYRVRNCYVNSPLERLRSFRTWKKRRKIALEGQ